MPTYSGSSFMGSSMSIPLGSTVPTEVQGFRDSVEGTETLAWGRYPMLGYLDPGCDMLTLSENLHDHDDNTSKIQPKGSKYANKDYFAQTIFTNM